MTYLVVLNTESATNLTPRRIYSTWKGVSEERLWKELPITVRYVPVTVLMSNRELFISSVDRSVTVDDFKSYRL